MCIDPAVLATFMRAGDKVSRDTNEECLTAIFSNLRSCVKYDSSIVMTFINIFIVNLKLQDIVDTILSKL